MKRLIEIQRDAEKYLGIFTLTTDYEIVYALLDLHGISPEALRNNTRLSSTAFYNRISALERNGTIISEVSQEDRRSRLYRLSADMRTLILDQHNGYMNIVKNISTPTEVNGYNLHTYQKYIHKGKIVNHLTAEFQIILYLYLKSGISNINISSVVDVSVTKFNTSLAKLVSIGLVRRSKDALDGRRKLYYLSDHTRGVLDVLHARVFEWLEKAPRSFEHTD